MVWHPDPPPTIESNLLIDGTKDLELKFVVFHLSDGSRYLYALPSMIEIEGIRRRELLHSEMVRQFCLENGFLPDKDQTTIYGATRGNIQLSVAGGGTLAVDHQKKHVHDKAESATYGKPSHGDVRGAIVAVTKDLEGFWSVDIRQVKQI